MSMAGRRSADAGGSSPCEHGGRKRSCKECKSPLTPQQGNVIFLIKRLG
jgi:hypothetical protein